MRRVIFFIPLLIAFGPFDSPRGLVKEGNLLFGEEKHDEALARYGRALELAKDKAPIDYNRGNVLLKKGDAEGAMKAFRESSASGDKPVKARSFYNMGNTLYGAGRYSEAANSYRESLRLDPSDIDTKINLEMALKKIEEQKQKKEQQEKDESDKDDSDKEREDGGEQKNDDRQQSPGGNEGDEEKKEDEKSGRDKEEAGDMTRQEAERLLENMGDRNMDLQNMADMVKEASPTRVEKDW